MHRTLTALIERGMVHPSLDTPTIYAAVDLDVALESAVKKQKSELREMWVRKRELQELAKQQRFRPSDEVATFKALKNVKEIFSFAAPLISSMNQEMLWVAPKQGLAGASLFGINDVVKGLVERGGSARGVTDISYSEIELVQELLDVGEEVRHFEWYRGVFMPSLTKCIA